MGDENIVAMHTHIGVSHQKVERNGFIVLYALLIHVYIQYTVIAMSLYTLADDDDDDDIMMMIMS